MTSKEHPPIRIMRKELHRRIWQVGPHLLANEFGITRRRLVEICDEVNVPYPGQHRRYPGPSKEISPSVAMPETPQNNSEIVVIESGKRTHAGGLESTNQHPLIVEWERQRTEARAYSKLPSRPIWSPAELRILKILSKIFRQVEKHGFTPKDDRQWRRFSFRYQTVEIRCSVREKQRRLREMNGDTGRTVFTLKPTGEFVFKIESYLGNASAIRREWTEKPTKPLEKMVPDIVTSLLDAGPTLVRREEEESERLRQHLKDKEAKALAAKLESIDRNQWATFVGYAQRLAAVAQIEKLIVLLEERTTELASVIDGRTISEWLKWARSRLERFDPRQASSEAIFSDLAKQIDDAEARRRQSFDV